MGYTEEFKDMESILKEGLRQSAAGETVDLGSFAKYAEDAEQNLLDVIYETLASRELTSDIDYIEGERTIGVTFGRNQFFVTVELA